MTDTSGQSEPMEEISSLFLQAAQAHNGAENAALTMADVRQAIFAQSLTASGIDIVSDAMKEARVQVGQNAKLLETVGTSARWAARGAAGVGAGIDFVKGAENNDPEAVSGAVGGFSSAVASAPVCAAAGSTAAAATLWTGPGAALAGGAVGLGCSLGFYMMGKDLGEVLNGSTGDVIGNSLIYGYNMGKFHGYNVGKSLLDLNLLPELGLNLPPEVSEEHVTNVVANIPPLLRDHETGELLPKNEQPYAYINDPVLADMADFEYDHVEAKLRMAGMEEAVLQGFLEEDRNYQDISSRLEEAVAENAPNVWALYQQRDEAVREILKSGDYRTALQERYGDEYEQAVRDAQESEAAFKTALENNIRDIGAEFLIQPQSAADIEAFRAAQLAYVEEATKAALGYTIDDLRERYGLEGESFEQAIEGGDVVARKALLERIAEDDPEVAGVLVDIFQLSDRLPDDPAPDVAPAADRQAPEASERLETAPAAEVPMV